MVIVGGQPGHGVLDAVLVDTDMRQCGDHPPRADQSTTAGARRLRHPGGAAEVRLSVLHDCESLPSACRQLLARRAAMSVQAGIGYAP
jgi:hypothetical protein